MTKPTSLYPDWQLLDDIDAVLDADFPLLERLQHVNQLLLEHPEIDAMWSITFGPMAQLACGLVKTPTRMAPEAKTQICDQCASAWLPTLNTLLGEALINHAPFFMAPFAPAHPIDADLGDALFNSFDITPVAVLPFIIENEVWGGMVLGQKNRHDRPIPPETQQLFIFVARQLAKKLHQLFLISRYKEQSQLVSRVAAAINANHGLADTAAAVYQQFQKLFLFDALVFSRLEPETERIQQWQINPQGSLPRPQLPLHDSRLAQAIHHPLLYSTARIDVPTFSDDTLLEAAGALSLLTVPLIVQQKIYGMLSLGSRVRQSYGPSEQFLLEQLAPHVAIVLEKSILLDEMAQRTAEMQTLNRLSEMMGSIVDLKQIAGVAITMLPRILTNDVYGVVINDEAGAIVGLAVPYNFQATEKIKKQVFNAFLELVDQRSIEIISTRIIPGNKPVDKNWQATASLTLPLITRQGTQGIIFSASGSQDTLSDNFLRVFSLVASQISTAIENAQLFHQVEQERARLAAILSSSTDAVLVVNRRERIVLDNPAARQILNATESQVGRKLSQATTLDSLITLFKTAMKSGSTTGEVPLPDGRTFFANLSPVAVDDSGIIGWVATMQDVSHFKELNDLKNEFVNTVSHDLRSPLSSILIAARLLEEDENLAEIQRDMLRIIANRVNSMSQLIDELLDVGRIEAGMDMELEVCRIADIIAEVVSSLLPQAAAKEIDLDMEIVPQLPLLRSNRHRLHQVIYNLVANAIKYTPSHGQVRVKAFTVPNELHIQIIDNGYGIPIADQPHLFEKFYRVKGEHLIGIKGTGLGLAIVKSIVDKLNGHVWVESAFGQGSTFTVSLPIDSARYN